MKGSFFDRTLDATTMLDTGYDQSETEARVIYRTGAHSQLDGRIAYRLKRAWPDGRTELVLPPVAFLRRLCGIIPPPRRPYSPLAYALPPPARVARTQQDGGCAVIGRAS